MQLFTANFVRNKCIFLTIFLQQKLVLVMSFLVVFVQVRVWDRKSAGRARVGMVCGTGRVRSVRVRGGCEQNFSNSCGCGAGADKNFNPRRTLMCTCLLEGDYLIGAFCSYRILRSCCAFCSGFLTRRWSLVWTWVT